MVIGPPASRTSTPAGAGPRQPEHQPQTTAATRGDLMSSNTPSAGDILAAAETLQGPQQTFTRAEVARLLQLAYDSGRTARYVEDIAELHATWARNPIHRPTPEDRYRERMAEMDALGQARAAAEGRPYRPYPGGGLGVDWETGRPLTPGEQVNA